MNIREFPKDHNLLNVERANKILNILGRTFLENEPGKIVAKRLENVDLEPEKTAVFALGKAAESMAAGIRDTNFRFSKLKIILAPFSINYSDSDLKIFSACVQQTFSYFRERLIVNTAFR